MKVLLMIFGCVFGIAMTARELSFSFKNFEKQICTKCGFVIPSEYGGFWGFFLAIFDFFLALVAYAPKIECPNCSNLVDHPPEEPSKEKFAEFYQGFESEKLKEILETQDRSFAPLTIEVIKETLVERENSKKGIPISF